MTCRINPRLLNGALVVHRIAIVVDGFQTKLPGGDYICVLVPR